jgi:hypothetical protein
MTFRLQFQSQMNPHGLSPQSSDRCGGNKDLLDR